MSCNCINNKPCNSEDNQKPQSPIQVINNIVYNQADNEDLEEVIQNGKSVLHFKDKLYNPEEYSGYGRVWLRKNIKKSSLCDCCDDEQKNILTQNMFFKQDNISPNTNTIYIVQYDYDLDGKTIIIPSDSVLVFDGGSFSNGQIILDNTLVVPPTLDLNDVFKNITLGGTYKEGQTIYKDKYLQYWDGKKWCKLQDTSSIQKMIDNLYKFLETLTVCVNITRTEDKTSYDIQQGGASRGIVEVPTLAAFTNTLKSLTFNKGSFTPITYNPTAESSVNIPTKVTDLEDGLSYVKTVTLNGKDNSPDTSGNVNLGNISIISNGTNHTPDDNGNINLGDLNITFKVGTKTVTSNLKDGTTVDLTDLINQLIDSAQLWKRTDTTLSPKTDGDNVSTSGKIYQGV